MLYFSMLLKSFKPWAWMFALLGIAGLCLSWKMLIKPQEIKHLQRGAVRTAERLRVDISEQVLNDLAQVEQIFLRIHQAYHKAPSAFIDELNQYFKRMHGLELIMLPSKGIDGSLVLFNPHGTRSVGFVSKKECDQGLAEHPERIKTYKNMTVYPLDNVLCVYDPVFHGFAILNLKFVLDDYLKKERMKGYFLALLDDASSETMASYWKNFGVHHEFFDFFGTHWAIKTYPSKAHVEASIKRDFWVFCLTVAGFMGLYFWWAWRRDRLLPVNAAYVNQLRQLALYDAVTDLPNRRYCLEHLDTLLKRSNRRHDQFSVCFIDCDEFKQINDKYGHQMGDLVLKYLADMVSSVIRSNDFFSRFAGDEFCLILEDTVSEEGIEGVFDKIFEGLSKPIFIAGHLIPLCISAGVAVYPKAGKRANILLDHADKAMYAAKRHKKNAYVIYQP